MKTLFKGVFVILVFLSVAAIIGRALFFQVVRTASYSMVPNLVAGDVFLVYSRATLGLGDVAVCRNPEDPSSMIALRVLGVPGTTFELRKNGLYINNEKMEHDYTKIMTYVDNTSGEQIQYDIRVAGEYVGGRGFEVALMDRGGGKNHPLTVVRSGFFLVGDNRNMSRDSRNFGEVPIESCIGRAFLVVWPGPDSGDIKRSGRFLSWID